MSAIPVIEATFRGVAHRLPFARRPAEATPMIEAILRACPVRTFHLLPSRSGGVVLLYAECDDGPTFPCAALTSAAASVFSDH